MCSSKPSLIPCISSSALGGLNRFYAAIKFFLYTLLGSLLMLVAPIYLFLQSGAAFNILDWHKLPLAMTVQVAVFAPSWSPSR